MDVGLVGANKKRLAFRPGRSNGLQAGKFTRLQDFLVSQERFVYPRSVAFSVF